MKLRRVRRVLTRVFERLGIIERSTVFSGAQSNRLTMDWFAAILSADQEIKSNLRVLRARARELGRNNPIAKYYLGTLATNVVGPHGITYGATVRNNDGKLNEVLNDKIEAAWEDFSKKGNCTVDGKMSLREVADLVIRNIAQDGEAFVRKIPAFDNKYRFAVQLLDPDQVDHTYSQAPEKGSNEIRLGVEVDKWGRPMAYHITPGHPSDIGGSFDRQRVPASEILHIYAPWRVNQTRGVTWFHPVMLQMRMLEGYTEAELVAARTGAAKMGFFTYSDPSAFDAPDPTKKLAMEANPGVFETLPPGMDFKEYRPEHPSQAFPQFVQSILRQIASGLGVSYNALANDLIGVNYSSMRSGLLIERDQWKRLQQWYIESFLQPLFDAWLPMALLSGKLVLDSRDPEKFSSGKWTPRGWDWVDPLKDIQASIMAIEAGLDTREAVIAERGGDMEETFEQLKEEKELAEEYGLDFTAQKTQKPELATEPPTDEVPGTGGSGQKSLDEDLGDLVLAGAPRRGRNGATNGATRK